MGERYGKGKSSRPQRKPIKNHAENGRVSRFDVIRPMKKEDVL